MYYATFRSLFSYDNTLFDGAKIPENINKETLIEIILERCGDNEVLYDNPHILKVMINAFFESGYYKYKGLADSTEYDYEPLVNYDLTITETRNRTDNRNRNLESEAEGKTETKVSAYDSDGYKPERQGTDNTTGTEKETENNTGEETITRNEKGDNSARSTQYMINEQRNILNFNVYYVIASDFEDEITIPVYSRRGVYLCNINSNL